MRFTLVMEGDLALVRYKEREPGAPFPAFASRWLTRVVAFAASRAALFDDLELERRLERRHDTVGGFCAHGQVVVARFCKRRGELPVHPLVGGCAFGSAAGPGGAVVEREFDRAQSGSRNRRPRPRR